jgi:hypothetical protein
MNELPTWNGQKVRSRQGPFSRQIIKEREMRRFVIREVTDIAKYYEDKETVTKTELIWRLDLAFRAGFCVLTEKMDWDKVINILLQKPKTSHCPKCGKARCECGGEK